MANFHLSGKAIGRSGGRSAVAAAAYRAGEELTDDRTGLVHDYTNKSGVVYSEIVMPGSAGDWRPDRSELWNGAEKANGRGDAVIAREFEWSLPHELNAEQRRALAVEFGQYLAERFNVAVDLNIHEPHEWGDKRNHHVHYQLTAKQIRGAGFGTKAIELDPVAMDRNKAFRGKPNGAEIMRPVAAALMNEALRAAGFNVRVDHRSFVDQGIDREATIHLGPDAAAMERRGASTAIGDHNRDVIAANALREKLKSDLATTHALIADEVAARAMNEQERKERAAVRTLDPAKILDVITERRSTFTRGDLNRLLAKEITEPKDRAAMTTDILARPEIIGLRETADAGISRYTTRAILSAEMQAMRDTGALAGNTRHGLTDRVREETLDHHHRLDREQRNAFDKATGTGGFAIIAGEAGTGKSTTLAAIRDAYEAGGKRVIGMGWTHAVVQNMKGDGFRDTSTVASALWNLDNGREKWDRKTVVMVDEAAMLSTKTIAALAHRAKEAGAKLILTGDDKQLSSMEAGGLFGALAQQHKQDVAELHNVRRVTDAEQRRAFNLMHKGDFRPALEIFDKRGAITWTQSDDEARAALVHKYAKDVTAEPEKARFVFANSNAEVRELNRDIRALHRERGELGKDRVLKAAGGEEAFARGDRIQFTGNGWGKQQREAGFTNGSAGTIRGIEGDRVTVALDTKKGQPERVLSFTVGENAKAGEFNSFRHGYAGTIYQGQGKTLDQTYVLHSASMGAAASYVGLSRHRDEMALFTTRGADAWMKATGGAEGLSKEQHKSAEASYARWAEAKPELAAKHGFADYVGFVQEQWKGREPDRSADLDRMAKQMGRVDDRRSASQFHHDGAAVEREQEKPKGRYAVLVRLGHYIAEKAAKGIEAAAGAVGRPVQQTAPQSYEERLATRMQGRAAEAERDAGAGPTRPADPGPTRPSPRGRGW